MFVPVQIGGGPDLPNQCYDVLKAAVGIGGSAPDESGIDGLWRMARAIGLSMGIADLERAARQACPISSQDLLPAWARMLALLTTSEEDALRQEVVAALPAIARNDARSLVAELEAIDSRLSVQVAADSTEWVTIDGRSFGPTSDVGEGYFGGAPADGATQCSRLPFFTSRSKLRVLFDVGHTGPLTSEESRVREMVRRKLRAILPAWWDFCVITSIGFLAGVSPAGLTGVTDG